MTAPAIIRQWARIMLAEAGKVRAARRPFTSYASAQPQIPAVVFLPGRHHPMAVPYWIDRRGAIRDAFLAYSSRGAQ